MLCDQAHCFLVARRGDQSLFEQLTLINTGKHRSCLCAERGAEVRATFLATGLFFSCEEKLVILCSLSRFGTFLGLAHAAMTAEGDNSVLMQKVFCILMFSQEPLDMTYHDSAGGQGAPGLLEQEPPNHDQAELDLPLRPHLSSQPSSKGAHMRTCNTLE